LERVRESNPRIQLGRPSAAEYFPRRFGQIASKSFVGRKQLFRIVQTDTEGKGLMSKLCREIADAMAASGAHYIIKAPDEQKAAAMRGLLEAFRDECNKHSVSIQPGDLTYYGGIVTATIKHLTR
jgi:hypothetical protein